MNVGATTPDQAHSGHGTPHARKSVYAEITVKKGTTSSAATSSR